MRFRKATREEITKKYSVEGWINSYSNSAAENGVSFYPDDEGFIPVINGKAYLTTTEGESPFRLIFSRRATRAWHARQCPVCGGNK